MPRAASLFDADAASYTGTVEVLSVRFRRDDGKFAVLWVRETESDERFAVVGPVGHLDVGDRAEVSGEWGEHSTYGQQLNAQGAVPVDPSDREGQIAYLTTLPHIGPARAERLLEAHSEGVLQAIAADPEGVLGSVRGLTADQAAEAAEYWQESRAVRDLYVQLAPHGLAHLAGAIHDRFEDEALSILHSNPYRLTEVAGVGFARADKIALAVDMAPESDERVQAAAVYALKEAEQQGNSFLPLEELVKRAAKLTGVQVDPDVLLRARGLVEEEGRIYRKRTLERERAVAETLLRRAAAPPHLDHEPSEEPPEPPGDEDKFTDEQWAAVRAAFGSRISVLTGGPGVGKTRCTEGIVREAQAAKAQIALCAPTGRAARRLDETTKHEAKTIHGLLEWVPGQEPGFHAGHPLPADLVIVDESSMLNLHLIEVLLDGLAESTHIVFVGDADQLPPIGAGKPFEDLIDSGAVPVVRLTQIFRQAAQSMITTAAHEINHGRPPHLEPGQDQEHDFFFIDRATPERALATVVEVVAERAPAKFAVDPVREVQVLAPMYKGPIGIDRLNEHLQAELNPDGEAALHGRFRIGDRLIQTRNSHELELMNGSIVFLRADDPAKKTITVDTDDGGSRVIPYRDADDLNLAYAISVHKAQGCEVPVVVGVCHRAHSHMLNRPLLYTAITRARKRCILVGDPAVLRAAVSRDDSGGRHSGLAERLRAAR
jgi:exodeoxyribonuclease V alpha subunit